MIDPAATLNAFIERVQREVEPLEGTTFFDLTANVCELVTAGVPVWAAERDLAAVVADPATMGQWRPNELFLYRAPKVELTIWNLEKARQYIHTIPYHAILVPCGQVALPYDVYRLPAGYRNGVFDRNLRLERLRSGLAAPGEALALPAGRGEVHDFPITRATPLLKLLYGPIEFAEWLFQRDSGLAWQISDSCLETTQLRVAAHILGTMARTDSIEALLKLTRHPAHTVRWTAIQNLAHINKSKALECLRAALEDPHPHVRRAASRTLEAFQARQQKAG